MHMKISVKDGLVHVILLVNHITLDGITALVKNSPNLII